MIALLRVDNRLVHGQVLEAWVPRLGARRIVVVDDEAAANPLALAAVTLAVPGELAAEVLPVDAVDWAALAAAPALAATVNGLGTSSPRSLRGGRWTVTTFRRKKRSSRY